MIYELELKGIILIKIILASLIIKNKINIYQLDMILRDYINEVNYILVHISLHKQFKFRKLINGKFMKLKQWMAMYYQVNRLIISNQ